MFRIFLAHAKEDKIAVINLYKELAEKGYQPWLDEHNLLAGQHWRAEIPKVIQESQVFIACLSQQSVAKHGYVQREFRMALNECASRPPEAIYLIPVRLDDCTIPDLRQEEYGINLRDIQWVDLFADDGFERLLISLELAKTKMTNSASVESGSSQLPAKSADKVSVDTVVESGSYLDKAERLRREISLLKEKRDRCFESRLLTTDPDREVTLERLEQKLEKDISLKEKLLSDIV